MSGSGGYYKYRCKYWLTYNCPHWVWVNNTPCAHCLAEGRDSDVTMVSGPLHISREVFVPQLENGSLQYIFMRIVAAGGDDDGYWALKDITTQPPPTPVGPSAVTVTAIDDFQTDKFSKTALQMYQEGPTGTGSSDDLE